MNLLLIEPEELSTDGHVILKDERSRHIQNTLKSKIGDFISAGIINGPIGKAEISKINNKNNYVEIHFKEDKKLKNPKPLNLVVVIALPRPKVARRIIRNCSEYGIKEIHFIHSFRVEKSYWQSPLIHEKNVKKQILFGLEQSKDTKLPSVVFHKKFKPFVEDELSNISSNKNLYVAHPDKYKNYPHIFSPKEIEKNSSNVVIIGPEGGFIDYEIDLLKTNNIKMINLGQRIFRTEIALSTIITLFSHY